MWLDCKDLKESLPVFNNIIMAKVLKLDNLSSIKRKTLLKRKQLSDRALQLLSQSDNEVKEKLGFSESGRQRPERYSDAQSTHNARSVSPYREEPTSSPNGRSPRAAPSIAQERPSVPSSLAPAPVTPKSSSQKQPSGVQPIRPPPTAAIPADDLLDTATINTPEVQLNRGELAAKRQADVDDKVEDALKQKRLVRAIYCTETKRTTHCWDRCL